MIRAGALAGLLTLSGLSADARADAPPVVLLPAPAQVAQREAARAALETYFAGELREGYPFLAIAQASIVGGATALLGGNQFARGAAIPALLFGAIDLAAGLWLLGQTESRVARLERELDADPAGLIARERKRLAGVETGFRVIQGVELGCVVAGLVASAVGGALQADTWAGVGVSTAVESGLLLLVDTYGRRRAKRYAGALRF